MSYVYFICCSYRNETFSGILNVENKIVSYENFIAAKKVISKKACWGGTPPELISMTSLSFLHEVTK